ncbi:hypothetical protein ACWKW4_20560 [Hydrogenophaga borbori]
MNRSFKSRWLLAPLAAAALVGCASMQGTTPSSAQLRDAASLGLSESRAAAEVAPVEPQWWRALGDPQLGPVNTSEVHQRQGRS